MAKDERRRIQEGSKRDMKLEDIGFYTLSDERAKNVSITSPLWRCELILTDRCNFDCPYCRKIERENLSLKDAKNITDIWTEGKLCNVRFSGGEPTLWPYLVELVEYTKNKNIERIAISTNGTADYKLYERLVKAGVNDFSISLDACCSSTANVMSGREGFYDKIIDNIKRISKLSYLTVGVVLTEQNINETLKIIKLADKLGVSDIRIIPAAQVSKTLPIIKDMDDKTLNKYPILKYRINNINNGNTIRGLKNTDSKHCALVMDDMAIFKNKHYPCIIYFREKGKAIGNVSDIKTMRQERVRWCNEHDCLKNDICRENCLDVCREYNNKVVYYKKNT